MNTELFKKELENLINRHSIEAGSDTPDFILSDYLMDALEAYDRATRRRQLWYGQTSLTKGRPLNIGTETGVAPEDCVAPECGCDSSSGCCQTK
jgi:hypothetical protein